MLRILALVALMVVGVAGLRLSMSVKGGKGGVSVSENIPRKLKRAISAASSADKVKALLTTENEAFLKSDKVKGEIYSTRTCCGGYWGAGERWEQSS